MRTGRLPRTPRMRTSRSQRQHHQTTRQHHQAAPPDSTHQHYISITASVLGTWTVLSATKHHQHYISITAAHITKCKPKLSHQTLMSSSITAHTHTQQTYKSNTANIQEQHYRKQSRQKLVCLLHRSFGSLCAFLAAAVRTDRGIGSGWLPLIVRRCGSMTSKTVVGSM